ncbi:MAG: SapC family protein [Oceanobacter sp.]
MAKQLLIYSKAQAVSSQRHRNWTVKAGHTFEFARDVNSVPLTAVEIPPAANEYPVVFAGEGDNIMPVAIMGMRDNENLYVNVEGQFEGKYVPAFLRRYPFVFSSTDAGDNFTLCIDEEFSGCAENGPGERLFDSEGEQTQYLKNVLGFLKEYQLQFARTQAFCRKLNELGLLESMGAEVSRGDGSKMTLTGFKAINHDKLKALPGDQLEALAKTDGLELAYMHLFSLRHFTSMAARVPAPVKAETKTEEKAEA